MKRGAMAYHNDQGSLEGGDGFSISWDIRVMPHRIDVFNAEGIQQYRTSGDIPHPYLNRAIEQFLRDHAAQQMVMEW